MESAIDDNMRRMFELPNMVVGWTSGRDGDGRPIEYNNSFDILYIPINARAVARSNFWISTKNDEDNSHSEHERYEKFVRLNYDDVLGTLNSNKWLRKDDLLRVTVLFESENLVANTAPNIIVFKTHPGNPDPNSQDSNYAYKMGAGFTEGTLGVGNGRINYTEWKSGNNINFLTQAWAGGRLPLGAAVAQSTDQDSHAGDGYGVRVLFDKDGFLKGLWLIASRDTNDQTDDIKLGFFVMLHFTNGKCKYLAKISNSVSNRNGAASEIKVKGVAWRLIDDKVEGLHDLVNGGIFLTRAFDYQYNPYGVVKGGKTSSLYVNPFSLPSYANDDNFNIDDNFKTDLTENFGPNFTGGISISTYANKQEGDRFGDDDCNIPFKRDPTADYGYCSMLYQMFAKVFEVTEFNGNSYVAPQSLRFDIKDAASPIWAREVGSAVAKQFDYYVPKIGSVDMLSCLSPGPAGCGMNRLNQFTVNTTDDEDVYIAGSGIASIKFFAWADAAQMPLRSFKVDFDNGATIYQSDSKNHANYKYLCGITTFCKGANSEDSNIPCENNQQCAKFNNTWTCQEPANGTEAKKRGGFGSTTDKGCTERFYEIFGNYSCDVKDLYDPSVGRAVWKEDIAAEKKYGNGGHFAVMRNKPVNSWDILLTQKAQWMGLTDGSVVCAYRPKVQILDNWGWCSGRCVKDYTARGQPIEPATNGCYNELKEYIHQCGGYVGANPWLPFGGFDSEKNVIVIPSS